MKGKILVEIRKDLEDLLLNFNLKTSVNLIITDKEKIIYYIGESEKCVDYLYAEISENLKSIVSNYKDVKFFNADETLPILNGDKEVYVNQALCNIAKDDSYTKCIIFYKVDKEFTSDEVFMINSTIYLVKKYFN